MSLNCVESIALCIIFLNLLPNGFIFGFIHLRVTKVLIWCYERTREFNFLLGVFLDSQIKMNPFERRFGANNSAIVYTACLLLR